MKGVSPHHWWEFSSGYLENVGFRAGLGNPSGITRKEWEGACLCCYPTPGTIFFSVIQKENEMLSISESARRRFLLFQRAFKQVIKARIQELAYPPVD